MRIEYLRAALFVAALFLAAACDEPKGSPAAPTQPSASSPAPTPAKVWKDLGEYSVTMTASASCSLPEYAVKQTYDGRLAESGQELVVSFKDKSFVCWAGPAGFQGTKAGDRVSFMLNGDYFVDGYSFVYLIRADTELGYMGIATGSIGENGIAARLNGTVLLYSYYGHKPFALCDAPDHLMELVRK